MQVYNEKTNEKKLLSRRMFDEQARKERKTTWTEQRAFYYRP